MSGAEVLGIISAVISIVDATIKLYHAAKDETGLPPNFKTVSTKLPLVSKLLEDTERYINNTADGTITATFTPVLKDCKEKATQLQQLFKKVISTEGDSRMDQYVKAARTIGKGGRVEALMKGILDNFQLLTVEFPEAMSSRGQVNLTEAIEEVKELDPSLPDGFEDAPSFAHYGSGAQNVNTGVGSQYNNNSTGNQNNSLGNQYIGTNHIDSSTYHHAAPERPETPPNPSILIPFGRDGDFVERGDILEKIAHSCSRPGSRTAIVGLGGVGKSQLAIEYAYRTQERFSDRWVFWVHASNSARFEQGFQDIAAFVKLRGRQDLNANIFQLVHDWLQDNRKGPWTIILDNVDNATFLKAPGPNSELAETTKSNAHPRQLRSYIPYCHHGSVLVTSRSRGAALALVEPANIIAIEPMDKRDALRLFRTKLGQSDDEACTVELAAILEYMPLAIVQAAAYVVHRRPRRSIQEYLDTLRKSDKRKASRLNIESEERRRDAEATNSILLTWQVSFDYIHENRPSAARMLSFMSFCDRQGIPEMLLRGQIDHTGDNSKPNQPTAKHHLDAGGDFNDAADNTKSIDGGDDNDIDLTEQESDYSDNDSFEDDIVILRNFSFIIAKEDGTTFEMHRLVQLATHQWLKSRGSYEMWQHQFLARLSAEIPSGEYENWVKCQALFPHALSIAPQRPTTNDSIKEWATILYKAAWFALKRGNRVEAEKLSVQAMKARKRIFDDEHEDVMRSTAMVASAYKLRGRWEEAEKLQTQVMETSKAKLGLDHPETLISTTNLAATYWSQGRWEEAEKLQTQVMETSKAKLGLDHPDTLISINNLAVTYKKQRRWEEAEKLQTQVMETSKAKLGLDYPDTLTSISNLAATYWSQGRWEEAEKLQTQVMETSKAKLGLDHPETLISMNNLAATYRKQRRWEEAEKLQTQVMETSKAKLGLDHPNTLTSISNLAATYMRQGRWEEAEKLQMQVMETFKAKLGDDHPGTLTSMHNLAYTWEKIGKNSAAIDLMLECNRLQKLKIGLNHLYTQKSISSLEEWRRSGGCRNLIA